MGSNRLAFGGVAAAVIALALPTAASADVLYDQTTGTPGSTVVSAHFTSPTGFDAEGADDFTVPPAVRWSLTSVDAPGEVEPGAGNVVVYQDNGGLPGSVVFQQNDIPYTAAGVINLPITGAPSLDPGHYWLSVFTTFSAFPWSWRVQIPTNGSPAVWENPGNSFMTGCTTWKPLSACGVTSGTDFEFRLNGTATAIPAPPCGNTAGATRSAGCVPPPKKCKRHKKRHRRAEAAKKKRCKHKKKSR